MTETGLIRCKRLKENPIKEKCTCLQMHFLVLFSPFWWLHFFPSSLKLCSQFLLPLLPVWNELLCVSLWRVCSLDVCACSCVCVYVKTRGEYWAPSLFLLTLFCESMSPTQPRAPWSRYTGRAANPEDLTVSTSPALGLTSTLFLLNPDARNLNSGPHEPYLQNPLHISQKQLEEGQFW